MERRGKRGKNLTLLEEYSCVARSALSPDCFTQYSSLPLKLAIGGHYFPAEM